MFNMNEVRIVMKYLDELRNAKLKYGKNISEMVIGDNIIVETAEVSQGQEKPIMIVSTVRPGGYRLDFVNKKEQIFQYDSLTFNDSML